MQTGCEKVGREGAKAILFRSGWVYFGRVNIKNMVFVLTELYILVGDHGP